MKECRLLEVVKEVQKSEFRSMEPQWDRLPRKGILMYLIGGSSELGIGI